MAGLDPLEFLRSHPPFDGLERASFRKIEDSLEVTFIPRGTVILRKDGAPGTHLWIIRKGAVRLERDRELVQMLEEGDCFGFPSLIAGAAPTSDCVAAEDTLCYRIPGAVFDELLEDRSFADFFMTDLAGRVRQAASMRSQPLASDLATPLERLVGRAPVLADPDEPVQGGAQRMTEHRVSSLVVVEPGEGAPLGIVTDQDLRSRVLATGRGPETKLRDIMTQPVKQLPATATLFEALVFMLEHNVQHVPLERDGRIVAMVTSGDLLRLQSHSPLHLLHNLERRGELALSAYGRDLPAMIESLSLGGLEAPQIARIVSRLNDSLVGLLLARAEAELGPPPCAYAWIAFGSEGRMEQALPTDQDNALVYETADSEAAAYFARLAERVIAGLIAASFPPCPGGYMATRWCKPLADFEALFAGWVERPEPQALLEAASFFDYRVVAGRLSLEPLEDILRSSGRGTRFLAHLAKDALRWKPPLGLFRQIRAQEGGVDLKKGGIYPIVALARVYALAAGASVRPTLDRLAAAADAGTLGAEAASTAAEAFRFLLGLRLRAQLQALRAGHAAGNQVDPGALTPLERRHLKDTFLAIADLQESTALRFSVQRLG